MSASGVGSSVYTARPPSLQVSNSPPTGANGPGMRAFGSFFSLRIGLYNANPGSYPSGLSLTVVEMNLAVAAMGDAVD
jgi:hypothetical protein